MIAGHSLGIFGLTLLQIFAIIIKLESEPKGGNCATTTSKSLKIFLYEATDSSYLHTLWFQIQRHLLWSNTVVLQWLLEQSTLQTDVNFIDDTSKGGWRILTVCSSERHLLAGNNQMTRSSKITEFHCSCWSQKNVLWFEISALK